MNKTKILSAFSKFGESTSKHSPLIFTCLAVAGFVGTVVLAVKATPKALAELELEREHKAEEMDEDPENVVLTKREIVKTTWKNYIPAAVSGIATIGCMTGSQIISSKRISSLAGLYSITNTAFEEYKDKVKQRLGDKEHQKTIEDIRQDHVNNSELSDKNPVIITGDGEMLCYDTISGRYFKSDIEKIRKLENKLNKIIIHDTFISLNDVYYELGLPNIKIGNDIGWNANHLIEFAFSSHLKNGEVPVLVIDYVVMPYHDYEKF